MATTIVLASGNLMSSSEGIIRRLPVVNMVISKNTTGSPIGFKGQSWCIGGTCTSFQVRRDFVAYSVQPGDHLPPTADSISAWQQWIFGIITAVIVPFFTRKWTKLSNLKDEVDTAVGEAEKIVDYVEEAAETVDKVAKDVAEHLPEGGKWKNAVVFVEGVAEEISREAHLVEHFLHEVEEVEEKVELLVESVKDQTKHPHEDLS